MRLGWKNCPKVEEGAYHDKDGNNSIILQVNKYLSPHVFAITKEKKLRVFFLVSIAHF